MRLKPRRLPMRKGLEDEPGTAHLADMYDRMSMEDRAWDILLNGTVLNRKAILGLAGGRDDKTAKAKVTFVVPLSSWEQRKA